MLNLNLNHEKAKFANLTSDLKLTEYEFNESGFKIAIKRAVRDLTARTLRTKSEKDEEDSLTQCLLSDAGDSFIKKITEYFSQKDDISQKDFDKWHHDTCKNLLNDINQYYKNPDGSCVCYGKAQKILNMTFKGCYCLKGADEREYLFTHCHMPLDSFTLEWFYREVATNWYNTQPSKKNKVKKTSLKSWSNLDYRDGLAAIRKDRLDKYIEDSSTRTTQDKFYHYSFIQDVISSFFSCDPTTDEQKRYQKFTPFQAEFFIWPEIQLHLAAEALFSQSIGQDEILEKMRKMLTEKNAEAIKEEEKKLDAAKKNGQKNVESLKGNIEKLSGGKDITAASKIYKKLPLSEKINLLEEKINILKKYCTLNSENQP